MDGVTPGHLLVRFLICLGLIAIFMGPPYLVLWWEERQLRRRARERAQLEAAMAGLGRVLDDGTRAYRALEFNLSSFSRRKPWEPEKPDRATKFPLRSR